MIRSLFALALAFFIAASVACSPIGDGETVRQYCDDDTAFLIQKKVSDLKPEIYTLTLRLGPASYHGLYGPCEPSNMLNQRTVNALERATTLEEVEKLIEKYKQVHAATLAAAKLAASQAAVQQNSGK